MELFQSIKMGVLYPETTGIADISQLLEDVLINNVLMALLATGAVASAIYNSYLITTSGGDDSKRKKGKDGLLYTAIGVILGLSSIEIISFLFNLMGATSSI